MKILLENNVLQVSNTSQKIKDYINVEFTTELDPSAHKFYYNINGEPFKELKGKFKIDKELFNTSVIIGIKTKETKNRNTRVYKTDPIPINIYASTQEPLNLALPKAFLDGLQRVRDAEAYCTEETEKLHKRFTELELQFKKLGKAVVELGKKGELL